MTSFLADKSIRPFWIKKELPSLAVLEKLQEVGFNTLILPPQTDMQTIKEIQQKGVKVATRGQMGDFGFCQSGDLGFDAADLTEYERVKREISHLESESKKPLIYFIKTENELQAKRQAEWLGRLACEINKETHLAFFAHLPSSLFPNPILHPAIQKIAKEYPQSYFKLLPLMHIPCYQEEKFPLFSFELYESLFLCSQKMHIQGVGCIVDSVLQSDSTHFEGSFFQLILWIINRRHVNECLENWLSYYHNGCPQDVALRIILRLDHLIMHLSELQATKGEMRKNKIALCQALHDEISYKIQELPTSTLKRDFTYFLGLLLKSLRA